MLIEQFITDLKTAYPVEVVDYTYSTVNGWDPLIIKLKMNDLTKFISKYNYSGTFRTVRYTVTGQNVFFHAKVGNDILLML